MRDEFHLEERFGIGAEIFTESSSISNLKLSLFMAVIVFFFHRLRVKCVLENIYFI